MNFIPIYDRMKLQYEIESINIYFHMFFSLKIFTLWKYLCK